ncbi:hypothetical protein [Clostridium tetani]|uniref:Uncharacterized protein n=1 Tax=Clostridium tetani TaxID=1513 RepID=A0ABC8EGT7_CLOTA|nr:hypothetical protein [Clostridium tetani]BDR82533.1 hypothetical protein K234311028_p20160 [Clostridium tetani]
MEAWRENLEKYFNGGIKLFEEDYKITCKCRYRKNGKWILAKIDMEHGIIYSRKGKVLRRCN